MLSSEELQKRFGSHKAKIEGPSKAPLHRELRREFMDFANRLNQKLPPGRFKALAMTELESASMWAHKSIGIDNWDLDEEDYD